MLIMSRFENKVLLITGGTGSFGHAVLDRFLTTDIREIRILSRDEKKQDDMRHAYQLACPACAEKIKFYIGDVRDYRSIAPAFRGVDYVFHAAALKQVPSCEFFPMEAVKTNVIGSNNVIDACVENRVKKAIFLSTDKAAYPINAMGMSKAMMEKNVIARSKQMLADDPVLCLTRYGNVMASRGSVIPLFCDQIDEGKPLTVTNPNMTRFMMTLSDAVDLVLYAFEHGEQGDLFVQKGADEVSVARMQEAGAKLGLAFQIQDDILDVTGSFEKLGKPIGSDAENEKATYVTFEGLEQAKKDVERLSGEAIKILDEFEGEHTFLHDLFFYLINRDH